MDFLVWVANLVNVRIQLFKITFPNKYLICCLGGDSGLNGYPGLVGMKGRPGAPGERKSSFLFRYSHL